MPNSDNGYIEAFMHACFNGYIEASIPAYKMAI
jgi:hypothetical protein